MGLRTTLHPQRGLVVAQVVGDVDILTAHSLRTDLGRGLSQSTRGLVIDLTRVGFIDNAGLAVLVGISRAAKLNGKYLALFRPRPRLREMLRTNGLYERFIIEPQNADDAIPADYPD